ncbi:CDGSH iron-sulfur domain-containing protein NEET-like [Zingiber officinale]|uniref:Iron-binding zinc finger CDGSH type domain-containing protein n=1 Tax=Zingiber officinale TaxID=94328 RepID=A0A8J5KUB8_ZINOF|nr:CDGSH iron-sulfur domain-containing protein NEET-like [Zingiber officinale]KAG6496314.1 hypothetical protein ZIOFF_044175 [Zingiber officinale]
MASSLMLATTVARLPSSPLEVRPTSRRRFAAAFTVRAVGGINPDVRKSEDKVVDSVVVAELTKPLTAYCRCWRSGTFPLCDGSHVKHNKATGDNVGPLLVKK